MWRLDPVRGPLVHDFNLETNNDGYREYRAPEISCTDFIPPQDVRIPTGTNIEGQLAATFWDLYDEMNDAGPYNCDINVTYTARELWDGFNAWVQNSPEGETHKPYNIEEFGQSLLGDIPNWPGPVRELFRAHLGFPGQNYSPRFHFTQNTELSGFAFFLGDVYVDAGVELTILPNTTLCFLENSKLIVNGSLVADGISTDGVIVFTGDYADQQPKSPDYTPSFYWGGITAESPTGNIDLNYVSIKYAKVGLGLLKSDTDVTLSNIAVSRCITGIEVSRSKGSTLIQNSTINNNEIGLNIEETSPAVINSKFNSNERCGIFVSYGSNPKLNNNEIIYNGLSYVGDMSTGGIVSIASNPQMYLDFNPLVPFCGTNNTIAENGTAGLISLQNSIPRSEERL